MTNKHFSQPPTEIFRAKLSVLLGSVNAIWQSSNVDGSILEDDIKSVYHSSISMFLKTLDSSILDVSMNIYEGLPSDPFDTNLFSAAIQRDLQALFLEIAALDKMIAASFNSIISKREQVLHASKRVANKIADYLLYADTTRGGGFFFGDSFNTLSSIEVASSLNDTEECFISTDEGAIFLPLSGAPDRPKIKSIIINKNSNGNAGNNFSTDTAPGHNEILAIGDNEPNTWYEYERVTAFESDIPLVLDITFVLESPSIVNHIHINPINFGTATPVNIINIETSLDGADYQSIKDDVPILDFVSEDEETVFSLSPATSNFTGQGFYSFLPRRVQFIHLTLEQRTPYDINTLNGSRLRYGIGIRDINILGKKYKPSGSIISSPFTAPNEIKKFAMWASENPTEVSVLADISHSISTDDGATWLPIQPQGRSGTDTPELLNFNNIAEDSISTSTPVNEIRHKVSLERFIDAFSGQATTKEEKLDKEELLAVSITGVSEIILTEEPIKESVSLIAPYLGSYGCPRNSQGSLVVGRSKLSNLDYVEFNIDSPPTGTIRFSLPYSPSEIDNLLFKIRIFVNGEQWEYSNSDINKLGQGTSYDGIIDEESKIYFLNNDGRELQFGISDSDGTNYGKVPLQGTKIEICLDGDNPSLELIEQGYLLSLTLPSDGVKKNVEIVSFESLNDTEKFNIRKKVSAHTRNAGVIQPDSFVNVEGLPNPPEFLADIVIEERDLDTDELIETPDKVHEIQVDYVDGESEFYDSGTGFHPERYSFNSENGIVVFATKTQPNRTTYIVAERLKVFNITEDSWSFYKNPTTNQVDTSKILINPANVKTTKRIQNYEVSSSQNSISLISSNFNQHDWHNQRIVKGTVKLPETLFSADAKPTEVLFVDGQTELSNTVQVLGESIPASTTKTTIYVLKGVNTTSALIDSTVGFSPVRLLNQTQAPASQFIKYIPNGGTLVDEGDWTYVKELDGTVTISINYTGGINEHYVNYEYEVLDAGIDYKGQYSVDYINGVIYLAEQPELTSPSAFHLIEFEVSLYSAFYNLARSVTSNMIQEIIPEDKTIILSQSFIQDLIKQDTILKARPQYMKVTYQYYKKTTQSLQDLEPYFSPIAKDVAFKAVTIDVLEEL